LLLLVGFTIETPWSVLECRFGQTFPSPSSLKQLEDVLNEEWYNIPLETVHNLHDSIPVRIQAILQAKGGPTAY
jgi:hypothetical protein